MRKTLRVMRQGQGGSGRKGVDAKVQGSPRSSADGIWYRKFREVSLPCLACRDVLVLSVHRGRPKDVMFRNDEKSTKQIYQFKQILHLGLPYTTLTVGVTCCWTIFNYLKSQIFVFLFLTLDNGINMTDTERKETLSIGLQTDSLSLLWMCKKLTMKGILKFLSGRHSVFTHTTLHCTSMRLML